MGACNSVDTVECTLNEVRHDTMSMKDFQQWVDDGIKRGGDGIDGDVGRRPNVDFNESVRKARNFIRDCNDPLKGKDIGTVKQSVKQTTKQTSKNTTDSYYSSSYYTDSDVDHILRRQDEYSDSSHTSDYIYLNK